MHLFVVLPAIAAFVVLAIGFYEAIAFFAVLPVAILLYRLLLHNISTLPSEIQPNEKRVIFVTGAGSGIGLATANLFLEKGWVVGYYDVNIKAVKAAVEKRVEEIGKKQCHFGFIDVTDPASCETALRDFLHHSGVSHIDCLFNCAGLLAIGEFDELPLARQVKQIDVNISGVVNLTYHAIPYLSKSKYGGRMVSMASASAVGGIPLHAVYSSTKAAIYSLTEALNIELYNKYNICCCDVSVGYVATPMVHDQNRSDTIALSLKNNYLKPEDVANIVYFAAHHCRRHREHFYESSVWFVFKFNFLNRAIGSRFMNYCIELTNAPKDGWKSASGMKSKEKEVQTTANSKKTE